ncbi:hypothetical protein ACFQX7_27095 [Luedemannella flava]
MPLYLVDDELVDGLCIDNGTEPILGSNPRGWTLDAGRRGRVCDAWQVELSDRWPYTLPQDIDDAAAKEWWNGFTYSPWQLLELPRAVNQYEFIRSGMRTSAFEQRALQSRRLTCVLAALATRYLPSVLGRLSFPPGVDEAALRRYRATSDLLELIQVAGFEPSDLRTEADALLLHAHKDPLAKWLPLVRYASYAGWSKLRGAPLAAMWHRVAAEVLLRAHEDLAGEGVVDPLPDLSGTSWWAAQHDRLAPRYAEAETLERALAELGLSPHPKVILLVEGETELYHVPRLLAEFGLSRPQDVRAQRTKGSKINAHLIARYGVTPRVGRRLHDRWMLDASPTALYIAMDPENDFATQAKRRRSGPTCRQPSARR